MPTDYLKEFVYSPITDDQHPWFDVDLLAITKRKLHAINLHLQGYSWRAIARKLKVDNATISNWRFSKTFRKALTQSKRMLLEESESLTAVVVSECLYKVMEHLQSGDEKLESKAMATGLTYCARIQQATTRDMEINRLQKQVETLKSELKGLLPPDITYEEKIKAIIDNELGNEED
jgi:transposase-like protein